MGTIDYEAIYNQNQDDWKALTKNPQKYEALLAGHYSDSNHFVYELLQNAEDAFDNNAGIEADKVVIEYYSDKLVFYHNGKPFDYADVKGVSSMLMGTKTQNRDDAQTIGHFGMGFKSVFKYTYQPEIYSDNEAFKITNYLLPVEIKRGWNFKAEKKSVTCRLSNGQFFLPFSNEEHLTKIVIPFKKYGKDGKLTPVPGNDVLKKLNELNGEILLFLTHIKSLYWINKDTDRFAYITLERNENDKNLITCRIEKSSNDGKEQITRYLKYKKVFNHKEMKKAEVSVAYKLNSRADNINEVSKSPIWVYFPTKDDTKLPFLIHGSFETAVSREKLMDPSSFNMDLFDELGDLIADSMVDLAKRNLITQAFIRRSLLAAFEDEEENFTIPGLKKKVTSIFRQKGLLPDRTGKYRKPENLYLPIPFRMADFVEEPLTKGVFGGKLFVAFNNERETKFTEYYNWLVDDLGVEKYKLSDLATDLDFFFNRKISIPSKEYDNLKDFYDFLSDNMESVYSTGLTFMRSGPYELALRKDLKDAWKKLRETPLILNRINKLVPSHENNKLAIYLGSSSDYKSVMQSALVNKNIADKFKRVLQEGFLIEDFNNFQYVKEKVIKKYIDIEDTLRFDNEDDFTEEYVEDLKQIFALLKESSNANETGELLKEAYIIKTKQRKEDGGGFAKPCDCFVPKSDEGIDLNLYYEPIKKKNFFGGYTEGNLENFDHFAVDTVFYEENGISISMLSKLGLITSPISEGRRNQDGKGDEHWVALGEFCPEIEIDGLYENLAYINYYPEEKLAKRKSAEILKLLLLISNKLYGKKQFRKTNPYVGEPDYAPIVRRWIRNFDWVFDKEMNARNITELSRFELNTALYNDYLGDKEAYKILGFIEKEADEKEETFQKASVLNRKDKKLLLNQLARELGLKIVERDDEGSDTFGSKEGEGFNPLKWQDEEFPIKRINNMNYLVRHVQEQFYCADPVSYKQVLRQIRVSKDIKSDRSYAIGMYTNPSNITICQMCKKPVAFPEVNQISNFGIEMAQLNLCFCLNCSAKYKAMRDGNKDSFKKEICKAIKSLNVNDKSDEYIIKFSDDIAISFTQTHIAEIQEIFRLIDEYGIPQGEFSEQSQERIIDKTRNTGEKPNTPVPGVSYAGGFVSFKKKNSQGASDIIDVVLEPNKYPLHKVLVGHKVGDKVFFQGKEYEIIGL